MRRFQRLSRGKLAALVCSGGMMFQLSGCDFGQINATVTLSGEEIITTLVRGAITGPLNEFINDTVSGLFNDGS